MNARGWVGIGLVLGLAAVTAGCAKSQFCMRFLPDDVINEYKAEGNGHPLEVDIVCLDQKDAKDYPEVRTVTADQWFGTGGAEGLRETKYTDLRNRGRIYSFTDNEQIGKGRLGPALRGRAQEQKLGEVSAQVNHPQPSKAESEMLVFAKFYADDGKVRVRPPLRLTPVAKQPEEINIKVDRVKLDPVDLKEAREVTSTRPS